MQTRSSLESPSWTEASEAPTASERVELTTAQEWQIDSAKPPRKKRVGKFLVKGEEPDSSK